MWNNNKSRTLSYLAAKLFSMFHTSLDFMSTFIFLFLKYMGLIQEHGTHDGKTHPRWKNERNMCGPVQSRNDV
jgi:hypothetical protein